jgi:hypothetical protein
LQEKWDKAKGQVAGLASKKLRVDTKTNLDDKKLEHIRGFLVHLSIMYETITPLLKGLDLTLAGHLPQ